MQSSADGIVARHIKAEMVRNGRNQAEIATLLDLTQQAVSRRLIGRTPFQMAEVIVLAQYFGVDVAYLLPSEGEATRKSEQDSVSPAPDHGEPGSRSGWTDSLPSLNQAVAS